MTNSATPAPTNPPHIALVASAAEGIGSATVIADVKPQRTELDGIAEEVKTTEQEFDGLDVASDLTGTTDFDRIVLDLLLARCSAGYDQTRAWRKDYRRIIGPGDREQRVDINGASKAATQSFTQALGKFKASELGSYNITVNDYAPGPVDTPQPDSRIPLGRIATAEDIANLVSFFVGQGRGLNYWPDSHD
ncbi:hypothetical protein EV702DRAFT_1041854 [Suillus placidus]|uniref:Uncharacterized protein n=1 Tax=Suillus placidus TaxID=48579 RepID=A0A9P7D7R1_9AGAM|nr:hypothetical protein EV702DRAFT_1041854 [Suillus placidus]